MKTLKQRFNEIWAKDAMVIFYPDVELKVREWLEQKLIPCNPTKHRKQATRNEFIHRLLEELKE